MVAHTPFDGPTDADLEDTGRMWLDQLFGRRNFEPSSFMSFISEPRPVGAGRLARFICGSPER
jgi:hypothetical protein